jgi:hypothetical protein
MERTPLRWLLLVVLVAGLGALVLAPAADAALVARPSLKTTRGATKIVVVLTSSRAWRARTRPRSVKVKAGGHTYALRKVTGRVAGVARGSSATWATSGYSGRAGASLLQLGGSHVTVIVHTRAGTTTLSPTLAGSKTGGGGGGPAPVPTATAPGPGQQPLFAPPGRELSGNEAFNSFSRYFLNSRFTDCPAGWPNCAVEERYVHCPNFGWEYHRYTPTSGSDINSYGSFQVTGATQHADGSWAVSYTETAYGSQHFYYWAVATNGSVAGTYDGSALPAMVWEQPGPC